MAFRTIQKSTGTPSIKRSHIRAAVRSVTRGAHDGRLIAVGARRVRIGSSKSSPARVHKSRKAQGSKRRAG